MKTLNYMVWILCISLMVFIASVAVIETTGTHSQLPEDRYRWYSQRATELRAEAQKCLVNTNYPGYHEAIRAEGIANLLATTYRDEYNRQLGVRLVRDLWVTRDADLIRRTYEASKL